MVIVFSNGPDNASMVAPDDVRAVAEDEGIPIYVISTTEVNKDPISSAVFSRIAQRTGGKAYFAKTWQKQVEAFEDIREDLGNSYTVTYYPQANPNEGFRKISVEIVSDPGKKYRIQCRPGYRPEPKRVNICRRRTRDADQEYRRHPRPLGVHLRLEISFMRPSAASATAESYRARPSADCTSTLRSIP